MKKLAKLASVSLLLSLASCGGGGSDSDNTFRLLQVGDQWVFTQTTTVLSDTDEAVATIVHEHTVTVVENPTDGSGTVRSGLALKSDYVQVSGPPAPVGTEYELFTQNAETRDVLLTGNITPSGAFLEKSGTIYLGEYSRGATYQYVGEINDSLITFEGTVTGREGVETMGQSIDSWVVDILEVSEPEGQNFHDDGEQTARIAPELGSRVQSEIEFDIGVPFTGRLRVESLMTATNVQPE